MTAGLARKLDRIALAVLQVGEGRGFVVEGQSQRYVFTAAHCLPTLPPYPFAGERVYRQLLGRIGDKPSVSADCLFVNPVADIAVLCSPDDTDSARQYESFIGGLASVSIGEAVTNATVWVLSPDMKWHACQLDWFGLGPCWTAGCELSASTSGSPIASNDGAVVAIAIASEDGQSAVDGGPHPRLTMDLPGRLLSELLRK